MKQYIVVPKRTMDHKEAEEWLNKPREPEPYPAEEFDELEEAENYAALARLAGYSAVVQNPQEFYAHREQQKLSKGKVIVRELDE
jgi:hypothetical protein